MNTVNQAPETISSIQGIISKIRDEIVDAELIIEDTRRLISKIDGAIKAWHTLNWDEVHTVSYTHLTLPTTPYV